ncbi:hypothetical protein NDU88_001408 [Pleurodeles waltl]|uniref:Uncharacterized protein n=1 Tax=Pleurodeles waltl TaxID=8319 RepID=A0AAV7SCJ7_PLEWA|nr:hypothetical protein NDU88_001408 [Pleurodeles waltl]
MATPHHTEAFSQLASVITVATKGYLHTGQCARRRVVSAARGLTTQDVRRWIPRFSAIRRCRNFGPMPSSHRARFPLPVAVLRIPRSVFT